MVDLHRWAVADAYLVRLRAPIWEAPASGGGRHCCRARAQGSRPWSTTRRCALPFASVLLEASRGGQQAMPMEMGNYSLPSIAAPALLYCSRLSAAEGWPRAEVLVVGQPTRSSSASAWTTTTPIPPIGDLAIHAKAPPAAFAEATQPAVAALALAPQARWNWAAEICRTYTKSFTRRPLGKRTTASDTTVMGERAVRERYNQRRSISLVLQRWRSRPRRSRPRQAQAGAGGV